MYASGIPSNLYICQLQPPDFEILTYSWLYGIDEVFPNRDRHDALKYSNGGVCVSKIAEKDHTNRNAETSVSHFSGVVAEWETNSGAGTSKEY